METRSHHGSSAPSFSLVVKSSMQSVSLKELFFCGLYSMLSCFSKSLGETLWWASQTSAHRRELYTGRALPQPRLRWRASSWCAAPVQGQTATICIRKEEQVSWRRWLSLWAVVVYSNAPLSCMWSSSKRTSPLMQSLLPMLLKCSVKSLFFWRPFSSSVPALTESSEGLLCSFSEGRSSSVSISPAGGAMLHISNTAAAAAVSAA